jgi:hypothetical protein
MANLRVVSITQEDPIYVAEFFRAFFAQPVPDGAEVVGAYILDTRGERSHAGLLRRMYSLYGAAVVVRLADLSRWTLFGIPVALFAVFVRWGRRFEARNDARSAPDRSPRTRIGAG